MTVPQRSDGGVSGNTFHGSTAAQNGDHSVQINQYSGLLAAAALRGWFSGSVRGRAWILVVIVMLALISSAAPVLVKNTSGIGPVPRTPAGLPSPDDPDASASVTSPTSAPRATQRTEDKPRPESAPPTIDPGEQDLRADQRATPEYARLYNRGTGMCLGVPRSSTANGTALIQWTCNTRIEDQAWALESVSGGYRVRNLASDKCLTIDNGSTAAGATAIQWTCGSGNEQVWVRDDLKRLKNLNSAYCLAIPHNGNTKGGKAIQWTCSENEDQQWLQL